MHDGIGNSSLLEGLKLEFYTSCKMFSGKVFETVVQWFLNLILFIYNSNVTNSVSHRCCYLSHVFQRDFYFLNRVYKYLTMIM